LSPEASEEELVAEVVRVLRDSELDCRDWSEEQRLELAREIVDALLAVT